jgi:short-subunit dehydrogenase involved in D-alanine esterification of teichoic acids
MCATPAAVARCAAGVGARQPGLSTVISNAGVQRLIDFADDAPGAPPPDAAALADLDAEVDTNLKGVLYVARAFAPLLRRPRPAGDAPPRLVHVSSGLAFVPLVAAPVYSATKAAVRAFTVALRAQLRPTGVQVVELIPPVVDTNLHRGLPRMPPRAMALDAFVRAAMRGLDARRDEVTVGDAGGPQDRRARGARPGPPPRQPPAVAGTSSTHAPTSAPMLRPALFTVALLGAASPGARLAAQPAAPATIPAFSLKDQFDRPLTREALAGAPVVFLVARARGADAAQRWSAALRGPARARGVRTVDVATSRGPRACCAGSSGAASEGHRPGILLDFEGGSGAPCAGDRAALVAVVYGADGRLRRAVELPIDGTDGATDRATGDQLLTATQRP